MENAIATATSEALLDVNWDVNMQITDSVLHGGLPAAQSAMAALRKRLSSKNPKAVQLALTVRGCCRAAWLPSPVQAPPHPLPSSLSPPSFSCTLLHLPAVRRPDPECWAPRAAGCQGHCSASGCPAGWARPSSWRGCRGAEAGSCPAGVPRAAGQRAPAAALCPGQPHAPSGRRAPPWRPRALCSSSSSLCCPPGPPPGPCHCLCCLRHAGQRPARHHCAPAGAGQHAALQPSSALPGPAQPHGPPTQGHPLLRGLPGCCRLPAPGAAQAARPGCPGLWRRHWHSAGAE